MKLLSPLPEHGWAYRWESLVRADNDAIYGSVYNRSISLPLLILTK